MHLPFWSPERLTNWAISTASNHLIRACWNKGFSLLVKEWSEGACSSDGCRLESWLCAWVCVPSKRPSNILPWRQCLYSQYWTGGQKLGKSLAVVLEGGEGEGLLAPPHRLVCTAWTRRAEEEMWKPAYMQPLWETPNNWSHVSNERGISRERLINK